MLLLKKNVESCSSYSDFEWGHKKKLWDPCHPCDSELRRQHHKATWEVTLEAVSLRLEGSKTVIFKLIVFLGCHEPPTYPAKEERLFPLNPVATQWGVLKWFGKFVNASGLNATVSDPLRFNKSAFEGTCKDLLHIQSQGFDVFTLTRSLTFWFVALEGLKKIGHEKLLDETEVCGLVGYVHTRMKE